MGLSGPLLFFALASLVTGVLVSAGVVDGWQSEILTVGILTAVIAVVLWKPLKNFQNSKEKTDNSSDMIGLTLPVSSEVSTDSGTVRYSGIEWQARLADQVELSSLSEASQCQVVAIVGNTLFVKPV